MSLVQLRVRCVWGFTNRAAHCCAYLLVVGTQPRHSVLGCVGLVLDEVVQSWRRGDPDLGRVAQNAYHALVLAPIDRNQAQVFASSFLLLLSLLLLLLLLLFVIVAMEHCKRWRCWGLLSLFMLLDLLLFGWLLPDVPCNRVERVDHNLVLKDAHKAPHAHQRPLVIVLFHNHHPRFQQNATNSTQRSKSA